MSGIPNGNSLIGGEQSFIISSWRHLSATIIRRYFRSGTTADKSFTSKLEEGYDSDSGNEDLNDGSLWDKQVSHESLTV